MTNSMPARLDAWKVIVGVDTHKHLHVAVAIDTHGVHLGEQSFAADAGGYHALMTWASTLGRIEAFGIEGTGSYGAGLARAVRRAGHRVAEVNRGDRLVRRAAGKSDTIDAEAAARSVLAGQATATPKTADGAVEMMRQLKIARDTAVKARTTAMITLKQIVVTASPALREPLQGLTDHALLTRCAGYRPGPLDTPTAAATHTLRALARRWIALAEEIAVHDRHLDRLTTETSPTLREGFGVGAGTAAQMLILFGDNPDRIRSEAAFAKLWRWRRGHGSESDARAGAASEGTASGAAIASLMTPSASPLHGEGYRKAWAKLRVEGMRTSKERVRRLMREHDLQGPPRAGHAHGPRAHAGTIPTAAPDVMWGTDMPATVTVGEGAAFVFVAVDHCTTECIGLHAAKSGSRVEALEPIRQGVRDRFGGIGADVARGLRLRHDHGSNYLADDFQQDVAFFGIESSPSFVREPEGHGVAERFIRTLKENVLWVRSFETIEELRLAVLAFTQTYNEQWMLEKYDDRSPAQVRRDLVGLDEAA